MFCFQMSASWYDSSNNVSFKFFDINRDVRPESRILVYTCSSELDSAEMLGWKTDSEFNGLVEDYDNDIIIRWGRSNRLLNREGNRAEFKNVINPRRAIRENVNKIAALKKLSEVVPIPDIYEGITPAGENIVIRNINHTRGTDFQVRPGGFYTDSEHYYLKFIKADKEYRVFFCGNNTMCAERFTVRPSRLAEEFPCRSLWPYRFCDTPSELSALALQAKEHLNLDAGCFDILAKDGQYYFLEANTATTINDSSRVREWYKSKLIELIQSRFSHLNIKF